MFGDSSTILNISQISQLPKDIEWKGEKICLTPEGTVTIYNLENQEHTGTYRCVRASPRSRQEVLTQVQIKSGDALLHLIDNHLVRFSNFQWIFKIINGLFSDRSPENWWCCRWGCSRCHPLHLYHRCYMLCLPEKGWGHFLSDSRHRILDICQKSGDSCGV